MKLSKNLKIDVAVCAEKWKCYDGCAACRFLVKAAEKGKEINSKELEKVFTEAENEAET